MAKKDKKNKYLVEKSKPYVDSIVKRAMSDFEKCARKVNDEMHDEVTNMYHTFIETFYEYHTVWYIRHDELWPGTEHGENLFRGSKFKKDNKHLKLHVDFSAENMDGGYKFNTPDQVLNYVMSGIRFKMESGDSMEIMTVDPNTMVYRGKYFSYKGGTIRDAFDEFGRQWDKLSSQAFYSKWGNYVRQWV